jgi:hypothetical protein
VNLYDAALHMDEGGTEEEMLEAMQVLVDTGAAWTLQGRIGRQCADAIQAGLIRGPRVAKGQRSDRGRVMKQPPTGGFLYGEACGEPCRGGRCVLTLGHGGPPQTDMRHHSR